jgi:hypothetical protein
MLLACTLVTRYVLYAVHVAVADIFTKLSSKPISDSRIEQSL